MDRDAKFSEAFRIILRQAGVKAVRLPLNLSSDYLPSSPHVSRCFLQRHLKLGIIPYSN